MPLPVGSGADPPDPGLPDAGLPDAGLPDTGLPDTGLLGEAPPEDALGGANAAARLGGSSDVTWAQAKRQLPPSERQ